MRLRVGVVGLAIWLRNSGAHAEPIPGFTGKYNVGVRSLMVDFVNPDDPTSPNNVSTQYMATIYYPTEDAPPSAPERYIEPELAQMYADTYNFNISHLTWTLGRGAAFLSQPAGPSLIFAPGGWGPPTYGFAIMLSDLASRGYVVAALDHPYEQPFLRLPNGTGVQGLPIIFGGATTEFLNTFHAVRVREMVHFVNFWPELVARLCAPFRTDSIGAFGHSFGGSVALNAAIESNSIAAALNTDGSIFGRAAAGGPLSNTARPSLFLAQQGHTQDNEGGWGNFTRAQSGWWRVIYVDGTVHADWSDLTFWKLWGTNRTMGSIDGRRMVDIRSAYVSAFFDQHLRGESSPILDEASAEWPEVTVYAGSGI